MNIKEIEVKEIMTRTNLPVSDFAVNPYVGCLHSCCYTRMFQLQFSVKYTFDYLDVTHKS